jgi:hypothetical protein
MANPHTPHQGDVSITAHMPDFTTGTPIAYLCAPVTGRITMATAVPMGSASGSQSTLTLKISGTTVTGATLLLSNTVGTSTTKDLYGLIDHKGNVNEGDSITFTSDGASNDGTVACTVGVMIRPIKI